MPFQLSVAKALEPQEVVVLVTEAGYTSMRPGSQAFCLKRQDVTPTSCLP